MVSIDELEAVYYSSPIPENLGRLTFLGLVFDKVYFPNVYILEKGFDFDEVLAEVKRLENLDTIDRSTWITTALTRAALIPELRDFCVFSGTEDQKIFGGDLTSAGKLVEALHVQIHGPFPENFEPMWTPGYHKGLSGDAGIDYPTDYYYQCNALLYAAERGIPLINADPFLPVPALTGETAKNNSKLLSTIMAIQCVNLVLPEIGELEPAQIVELRGELRTEIKSFRLGLLKLARDLNSAIEAKSDEQEIIQAAQFIAKTEILPSLIELRDALSRPQQGWMARSWELTKKVPGLITA